MAGRKNNRYFLLQLRRKKKLVDHGIDALTSKRDALMKEFHGVVRQVAKSRKLLDQRMLSAAQALLTAEGLEQKIDLSSAADAATRDLPVTVSTKNIWGVRVPVIKAPDARRALFGRGSAPLYRSPAVDEAAGRFELVLNAMFASAELESRLVRLGLALKKTSRRLNALEQKVAPEIVADIKIVGTFLEEQAREEVFRLKRFKARKSQV